MLVKANAETFSCITVDGDTSTSDTVLLFATGAAGNVVLNGWDSRGADAFYAALLDVCRELAQLVVRDGEGATKFITIRVTGAEVMRRLEQAATVFAQLTPNTPSQYLHNQAVPIFNFDTYFGLHYDIDPLLPTGQRIKNLRHGETPVLPNQQFVLVTNQFRAAGGGGYDPLPADHVILRSDQRLEEGLTEVLSKPCPSNWVPPWRIAPSSPVSANIETSPDALQHLQQIARLSPDVGPTTAEGFVELRVTF